MKLTWEQIAKIKPHLETLIQAHLYGSKISSVFIEPNGEISALIRGAFNVYRLDLLMENLGYASGSITAIDQNVCSLLIKHAVIPQEILDVAEQQS